MLYKVFLTFESVDEILDDHSNETAHVIPLGWIISADVPSSHIPRQQDVFKGEVS